MDYGHLFVSLAMLGGIALYFGIGGLIADHMEARRLRNRGMATRIER